MMALLTLFTAPKPFTDPHIATIQRNAIQSWLHLPDVEVLLVGEEEGLAQVAAEFDVRHLPEVARNDKGTPLVSSIFDLARRNSEGPLMAYVNADILVLPDLIAAARQVTSQAEKFLIVGQRWDLDVREPLDFSGDWEARLQTLIRARGQLHRPMGSDYFIFPRACFTDIPPFAIGRAGWDNWGIYEARRCKWLVIDSTKAITIIHQNHDYSHLPGGQPHYRLPETEENIRLAGGREFTRFTLLDASHELAGSRIQVRPWTKERRAREREMFPLVQVRSPRLARLLWRVFHPRKAYAEWRKKQAQGRAEPLVANTET